MDPSQAVNFGANAQSVSAAKVQALLEAAQRGDLEVLKKAALEVPVTITAGEHGTTALHEASAEGHPDVVNWLLEEGKVPVDHPNYHGITALQIACFFGRIEVMRLLVEKGANLAIVSKDKHTLLHTAVVSNRLDSINFLLDKGCPIDRAVPPLMRTPLHLACIKGFDACVKLLMDRGASTECVDDKGYTPLVVACIAEKYTIVRLLIDRGACKKDAEDSVKSGISAVEFALSSNNRNLLSRLLSSGAYPMSYVVDPKFVTEDSPGQMPAEWVTLAKAAFDGDLKLVEKLLSEKKVNLNLANARGVTVLHSAAMANHLDVVKLLVEHGASIHAVNARGATPLFYASDCGNLEMIRFLLDRGASIEPENASVPLYIASAMGRVEAVKLLLDRGANINKLNAEGVSPLFIACQEGYVDVARVLLDRGASMGPGRTDASTPLHVASWNGEVEAVRLLLDRGADPSHMGGGETALHAAIRVKKVEVCLLLIERGAPVDAVGFRGSDGLTPLTMCCLNGLYDVARSLLEHGADINKAASGMTPLHVAARNDQPAIVQLLLERGATRENLTHQNETALVIAASIGSERAVEILIAYGADVSPAAAAKSPLASAIAKGHTRIADILRLSGAKMKDEEKWALKAAGLLKPPVRLRLIVIPRRRLRIRRPRPPAVSGLNLADYAFEEN